MKKELALTLGIALCSAALSFGICKNQIDTNKSNIERLEVTHKADIVEVREHQNQSDILLQSINTQLASLNTKMDLILEGKLGVTTK